MIQDFFKSLEDKVSYVQKNLQNEAYQSIDRNKEKILDLNRQDQLFKLGIDSNGNNLFPTYSNVTIFDKRQKGLPFNRVTLFDTGSFYDGFDILKRRNEILIFSRDSKSSDLQDKYGSAIFGLTSKNEDVLNYEILLADIRSFVLKTIPEFN